MIKYDWDTPLKYLIVIGTYSTQSRPQLLGTDSMVEAKPPVLLCGLLKVHSKHSSRAVTLIQQSCMSSYHIAVCYNKKLNKLVYLKKCYFKKE